MNLFCERPGKEAVLVHNKNKSHWQQKKSIQIFNSLKNIITFLCFIKGLKYRVVNVVPGPGGRSLLFQALYSSYSFCVEEWELHIQ